MDDIQKLVDRAEVIRTEQTKNANTAERVGSLFKDIASKLGETVGGLVIYREVKQFEALPAACAFYEGTPQGCSTSVYIKAEKLGVAGNNIHLMGNGEDTISALIDAWNSSSSNKAVLKSGDGNQKPDDKTLIRLNGGLDYGYPSSYSFSHNLDSYMLRVTIMNSNAVYHMSHMPWFNQSIYRDSTGRYQIKLINQEIIFEVLSGVFNANPYYIVVEKLY